MISNIDIYKYLYIEKFLQLQILDPSGSWVIIAFRFRTNILEFAIKKLLYTNTFTYKYIYNKSFIYKKLFDTQKLFTQISVYTQLFFTEAFTYRCSCRYLH